MVTLLLMVTVLLSEMVVQVGASEKLMVSPGDEWATTEGSDPLTDRNRNSW